MTQLEWDVEGKHLFETGVELGVLYIPDENGEYTNGYVWNGLTTVTETISGGEVSAFYASNKKYVSIVSRDEFGGTIEAYTYPHQFLPFDGVVKFDSNVALYQQTRRSFGFSFVSLLGNDLEGTDFGFKLHLVWQAVASPSERAYTAVSDSPEPLAFSWEFTTIPVKIDALGLKPTSSMTLDSTKVEPARLAYLQNILYGSGGKKPRLPDPLEVLSIMFGIYGDYDDGSPDYSSPGLLDGGAVLDLSFGRLDEGVVHQSTTQPTDSDTISEPLGEYF